MKFNFMMEEREKYSLSLESHSLVQFDNSLRRQELEQSRYVTQTFKGTQTQQVRRNNMHYIVLQWFDYIENHIRA